MENQEQKKRDLESTHKTRIEKEAVLEKLSTLFGRVSDVEYISGGEGSQAFSFKEGGEDFIIRINKHSSQGYKKDKEAFSRFKKYIPMAEITTIGILDNGYHFAISKKVEGETFKHLSSENKEKVMTDLFKTLETIHSIDISSEEGFGKWGADKPAEYGSWKEMLLGVGKHLGDETEGNSLFQTSFLEKEVWGKIYQRFVGLVEFCPEEKYLVHGDYGFDNLLIKDEKVTGVIDWEHSMYGDFLFDVAWLGFWSGESKYEKKYSEFVQKDIPHFQQRVLCYKLFIGLGSLSFYAYSNQKDKYERSKEKLLSLIGE